MNQEKYKRIEKVFLQNEGRYFIFEDKIYFGNFGLTIEELKPVDTQTLNMMVDLMNKDQFE